MKYAELPEFSHELKRLSKKYRSLPDDFEKLKQTLAKLTIRDGGNHWNCLYKNENIAIYKIRLACKYLRATTSRVIYAHHKEPARIVFIEIYFKGDKENEDLKRIRDYLKNF
ncbi:MAG: hypothetical protein AAB882_00350 [Patescibacteria group bacterium]